MLHIRSVLTHTATRSYLTCKDISLGYFEVGQFKLPCHVPSMCHPPGCKAGKSSTEDDHLALCRTMQVIAIEGMIVGVSESQAANRMRGCPS